ncbi:MAG: type I-C CRISPR-associated protein Cas5c [Firmicutes bacterium]|nr:type I-C CRISPR-associated protein Cas5c [Bacillota bacterium]
MVGIEVWGDFACFTRPETKVERLTYPVITPSAARGIFEAIYWKPQFRWVIEKIEILSPIRYISLRRNEVKDKVPSERIIGQWMTGRREITPLWADGTPDMLGTDEKGRTQRQTIALKSPHYRIFASVEPWPEYIKFSSKFQAQFLRRAAHGQCVYQPYLGLREFPAYFSLASAHHLPAPIDITEDWGHMVYDVFPRTSPGTPYSSPEVRVFSCQVKSGVVIVPHYSQLVIE